MKKLENLTLRKIEKKWVKGSRYYRSVGNGACYRKPITMNSFPGEDAIAKDWVLELPDEKPLSNREIFTAVSDASYWVRPDIEKGLEMARESERLKYQKLIHALNAFMDDYLDDGLIYHTEFLRKDIRSLNTILEEVEKR